MGSIWKWLAYKNKIRKQNQKQTTKPKRKLNQILPQISDRLVSLWFCLLATTSTWTIKDKEPKPEWLNSWWLIYIYILNRKPLNSWHYSQHIKCWNTAVNIVSVLVRHLRTLRCQEKNTKHLTLGSESNRNSIHTIDI